MKAFAKVLIMAVMSATMAFAQNPQAPPAAANVVTPKAPYDSSKAQLLVKDLIISQLSAKQLNSDYQQQMQQINQKFTDDSRALQTWIDEIRKQNGWDDTYNYDRAENKWTHTPKAETAKEPTNK